MMSVLVLISARFPKGSAITSRILNFCRLLRDSGFKVHVIATRSKGEEKVGQSYIIENISYEIVSQEAGHKIETIIGTPGYVKKVENFINENRPDCVFMVSMPAMFRKVVGILEKNNVPCFVEQCEWMDLSSYRLRRIDPRYLFAEYIRRWGARHVTGIISISRFLDNYFNALGVPSIRIPTILDVQNTFFQAETKHADGKIHIVFAGRLGGTKELMAPIIESLVENEDFRKNIQFDVYGPNKKQVVKNLGGKESLLDSAGSSVVIPGRISQDKVPEVYANSDYLIFVRPQRRSSDAGFPTKFAESMAVGTPVITNNTGDIGLYLQDGVNGFLLSDNTKEAVSECFEKLLAISKEKCLQMRLSARKTAEESFDYRVYVEKVSSFFAKNIEEKA